MKNDHESQDVDSVIWDALKKKYEKSLIPPGTYRPEASRKHNHDDHLDDHLEGEKEPSIQENDGWSIVQEKDDDEDIPEEATTEFLAEIQVNESRQEDATPQVLEKPTQVFQGRERDPNAQTRSSDHKVQCSNTLIYSTLEAQMGHMYYWQCHSKTRQGLDEVFSNAKIVEIIRVLHHDAYGQELIDEVCVKRSNDKAYLFS
ncbi:hypothetical protein Tco_0264552 [Tanacetum coccineum]